MDNDKDKEETLAKSVREMEEGFLRLRQKQVYRIIMEKVERPMIEKALERTFGNKLKAAKILGINRNTINAKIKRLGIDVSRFKEW